MENQIDIKFKELKKNKENALIAFITAGDPSLEFTKKAIMKIIENGGDIIEIGVPFNDPVAEGVTITNGIIRSLKNHTKMKDIFALVKEVKEELKTNVPILLMLYYNSLYAKGEDNFLESCRQSHIDGLIIPDLPYEESKELKAKAESKNIHLINILTLSSQERVQEIAKNSQGFIYCVTSKGVTGVRNSFNVEIEQLSAEIKKYTTTPLGFGFGISNKTQGDYFKKLGDGIIVGSAFVQKIENNLQNLDKALSEIGILTKSLKD